VVWLVTLPLPVSAPVLGPYGTGPDLFGDWAGAQPATNKISASITSFMKHPLS
jgi:hypothetical protein